MVAGVFQRASFLVMVNAEGATMVNLASMARRGVAKKDLHSLLP